MHVVHNIGMTAAEAEHTCGAASKGGQFVWPLRYDRRGLEEETRRGDGGKRWGGNLQIEKTC